MHVQSENQIGARHHLEIFDDGMVAVVGIDLLIAPLSEGMRAARRETQPVLPRQRDDLLPDTADFVTRFLNVPADAGADFDHRLVHFRLDALGEQQLALLHDFGVYVRAQVPRDGIHGLIFFFDSNTQARPD